MHCQNRAILKLLSVCTLAVAVIIPVKVWAQSTPTEATPVSASKTDQWIHVRVENKDDKDETVRVNVPVEMAVKVLPAINKEQLHHGRVHIDDAHLDDVDLRALLDAIRSSKDGEYVTVQSHENDVRVAKNNGYLYINVTDKSPKHKAAAKDKDGKEQAKSSAESKIEIKVPLKVVDALFSAGKNELDLVAALRALSANGDTELVRVKDADSTVHIWIDSKNIAD
jgi:hypothetical protein